MIIVPDTNILRTSFGLRSTEWKILLTGLVRAGFQLFIPEVVIAETVTLYSREAKQCQQELSKLNRKYAGLELKDRNLLDTSLHNVNPAKYESLLRKKLASATFLPLPEAPPQLVLRRILDQKQPFNEGESGYRDYLLWLSLLEIATANEDSIAFITSNTRDFCDDSARGTLSIDLIADLEEKQISPDRIQLYTSLALFNKAKMTPALEELTALQRRINSGTDKRLNKVRIARDSLEWLLGFEDIIAEHFGHATIGDSPALDTIQEPSEVSITDVRQLKEDEILIRFKAHVLATFRDYLDDERYRQMNTKPFVDSIDNGLITVSYEREFDVECEVTVDPDDGAITSGEVIAVVL